MKKSTFGAVKPLPGQSGYKVSETDNLEKDAREMEIRLKMLQDRMQQQKIEDENQLKQGGVRWNAAKPEKGSLMSYGKDLQEKYKKRREAEGGGDPALWATSKKSEKPKVQGDSLSKDVMNWTVQDISHWLKSLSLTQYVSCFEVNQINGAVLLELSLEDLDYMEIKALGHRKIILKGIEDLRKAKRALTPSSGASSQKTQDSRTVLSQSLKNENKKPESLRSNSITVEILSQQVADTKRAKHWSDIEPLSQSEVQNGSSVVLNSADYGEVLDEEAERKAFQEAVMEWRKANTSGKSADIKKGSGGNLWSNPFQESSEPDNINILGGSVINDNGTQGIESKKSLIDGELDEDAERLEFQRAVEAWRKSKNQESSPSASVMIAKQAGGTNTDSTPLISCKLLAEKLSQELDSEHERVLLSYKGKLEAARERQAKSKDALLVPSKTKDELKATIASRDTHIDANVGNINKGFEAMSIEAYSHEEEPYTEDDSALGSYFDESFVRDIAPKKKVDISKPLNHENKQSQFKGDFLQEFGNDDESEDEIEFQSFADVKLLDSVIGESKAVNEDEYIVEEVNDDEYS